MAKKAHAKVLEWIDPENAKPDNLKSAQQQKTKITNRDKERDDLDLKCVFCEKEAEYVKDGKSLCENHFKQYLQKMECLSKAQQVENRETDTLQIKLAQLNAEFQAYLAMLFGVLAFAVTLVVAGYQLGFENYPQIVPFKVDFAIVLFIFALGFALIGVHIRSKLGKCYKELKNLR
jgi:hypothetical protein